MNRRRFLRTRNPEVHIAAVRERRLLEFGEACVIAGKSRVEMKRALGPNGEPFEQIGRRLYIRPAILKIFLANQCAASRA